MYNYNKILQQNNENREQNNQTDKSINQDETISVDEQQQQKYYSVVKEDVENQVENLSISNKLSSSQIQAKIISDQSTTNQLNKLIQQLKQKKQLLKDSDQKDQNFQLFWIIEQNITNKQVAEYALNNGLVNELLRLSNEKGSLYCLSKILSLLTQKQQNLINSQDWKQLNLEVLTEENLEFLIQNCRLKCLKILMFKQKYIEKLLIIKSNYSNKIIKKIFICFDTFCTSISFAEQLYQYKIIEKILKFISIAQAECYLLIGSLCLSQNAQSEFIQSDIQVRILKSLKTKNIQLLANVFYALSGICYNQSFISIRLTDKELIDSMGFHLNIQSDIIIIEAISQLISNLTYNNDNIKQVLSKFIPELIQVALRLIQKFQNQNIKLYDCQKVLRSIFRALNNLIFLKSNAILAISNNLYDLCDFSFQNHLCAEEFFDILTNLGIHQLLNKKQILILNEIIQNKQRFEQLPQILDCLANSTNHFGKLICQEFNLDAYKQILIESQNVEIKSKFYRLIRNLLLEQENFIYIQQSDILTYITQSEDNNVQHYFENIITIVNERSKQSRIIGFQSESQSFFQYEILLIKGNFIAKPAQLKISQNAISVSQNGITKQKYIIKKLQFVDENMQQIQTKLQQKNKDLKLNLCLQLTGLNESKINKIIFQTLNDKEKQKIKTSLDNLIN